MLVYTLNNRQVSLSMLDLLVDFRRQRDKTDSTDFFWAGWGKALDYSEENNRKNLLLKEEENNAFDDFSK